MVCLESLVTNVSVNAAGGKNQCHWIHQRAGHSFSKLQTHHSGKEKTHKHKQICGIVRGLGGRQNFVYVFFSGHSLWGRKNT